MYYLKKNAKTLLFLLVLFEHVTTLAGKDCPVVTNSGNVLSERTIPFSVARLHHLITNKKLSSFFNRYTDQFFSYLSF